MNRHIIALGAFLALGSLGACAMLDRNPIVSDPGLRSGWTASKACNVYAAGVREAARRANSGDWTAQQDRVVDSVVQTYGPMCTPQVEPDAWRIGDALVNTFASVGIAVSQETRP